MKAEDALMSAVAEMKPPDIRLLDDDDETIEPPPPALIDDDPTTEEARAHERLHGRHVPR